VKKSLGVVLTIASAAGLLVVLQSCGVLGGAPTDVQLGTDSTGVNVLVVWNQPAEGIPDKYQIHFKALGETTYALLAETTAQSYRHETGGMTGTYKVTALFPGSSYEGDDRPTTVPYRTDTITVAELDASGNSGYGWNRETGLGRTYSMAKENCGYVDCYITNFETGSAMLPYCIASPSMAPSDRGGPVEPAEWKASGFTDQLASEQNPLPQRGPTTYFNWTDITQQPSIIGCSCVDGFYALVKITSVDAGVGEVRLLSWFQLVPGLRLVRHEVN